MERLNAVAEIVREKGAEVTVASIDVQDAQKIHDFIHQQDDLHPVPSGCSLSCRLTC